MKKKWIRLLLFLCITAVFLRWLGIGSYSSGSAVLDLKAELESMYGAEYTGKAVENGIEDMAFEIKPKTWFLTNWNLRNALGIGYKYQCQVIFTTYTDENSKIVRTITYKAVDPMGVGNGEARASLDQDSRTDAAEISAVH